MIAEEVGLAASAKLLDSIGLHPGVGDTAKIISTPNARGISPHLRLEFVKQGAIGIHIETITIRFVPKFPPIAVDAFGFEPFGDLHTAVRERLLAVIGPDIAPWRRTMPADRRQYPAAIEVNELRQVGQQGIDV